MCLQRRPASTGEPIALSTPIFCLLRMPPGDLPGVGWRDARKRLNDSTGHRRLSGLLNSPRFATASSTAFRPNDSNGAF